MEGLQKTLPVGFGVKADEIVMEFADKRAFAGCNLMQRRIFYHVSVIAHRVLDFLDGMACDASQPGLRRRSVQVFSDRSIHHAVQQDSEVMAPAAPLRRLNAVDILHVHYRLAIPLIVKRGKVMRRFVPLFVDVGVAVALGAGARG